MTCVEEDMEFYLVNAEESLDISLPYMGDVQNKKNPFGKPPQVDTCQHNKRPGLESLNMKNIYPKTMPSISSHKFPRPTPIQIPRPDDQAVEAIDEGFSRWMTEAELEMEEMPGRMANCIASASELNTEITYNFKVIKVLSLPTIDEVKERQLQLPKSSIPHSGEKTLLVDLDETLVHTINPVLEYSNDHISYKCCTDVVYKDNEDFGEVNMKVILRPYAIEFLKELSKIYEIIIFTASQSSYADTILKLLDPDNKYISHRLYRDSCIFKDSRYLKDLRILRNRDMENLIILDNSIACFANQLKNGIHISSYYGQDEDDCLKDVMALLKEIADCKNIQDELEKRVGLAKLYMEYVNSLE